MSLSVIIIQDVKNLGWSSSCSHIGAKGCSHCRRDIQGLYQATSGSQVSRCCVGPLHCWKLVGTYQRVPWYWESSMCIWKNMHVFHKTGVFFVLTPIKQTFPVSCFIHWICCDTWRQSTRHNKRRVLCQLMHWMCLTCSPAHIKKLTTTLGFIALMPTNMSWRKSWSMPLTQMCSVVDPRGAQGARTPPPPPSCTLLHSAILLCTLSPFVIIFILLCIPTHP